MTNYYILQFYLEQIFVVFLYSMKLKRSEGFIVLILFSLYSFSQILNIEDPALTLDSISNHDFKCGINAAIKDTRQLAPQNFRMATYED